MAKKNYRPYIMGGAILGGLYLLTRNVSAQITEPIPDGATSPGLLHYLSESTEWNDYQIMSAALPPDTPVIVIPYTKANTVNYLMETKGMTPEQADSEATMIINRGYPAIVAQLESLYSSSRMTIGDRAVVYDHLVPIYNVMETPNLERVPAPGATVSTTTPTSANVSTLSISDGQFGIIMDDITTIDGVSMVTFSGHYTNPQLTTEAYSNLYNLTVMESQLVNASQGGQWSTSQRAKLNAVYNLVMNRKSALTAASTDVSGFAGRQMTNRLGRRYARNVSGMKSWTKHKAQQMSESNRNAKTRDETLRNMRQGNEIDLYAPIDTLDVTSSSPTPDVNSVSDVGSALVNTRGSMRRLL